MGQLSRLSKETEKKERREEREKVEERRTQCDRLWQRRVLPFCIGRLKKWKICGVPLQYFPRYALPIFHLFHLLHVTDKLFHLVPRIRHFGSSSRSTICSTRLRLPCSIHLTKLCVHTCCDSLVISPFPSLLSRE